MDEQYVKTLGLRNRTQEAGIWFLLKQLELLSKDKDICPVTIEIDPINYCNHSCDWCLDQKHGGEKLSLDLVVNLAREIKNWSVNGTKARGIIIKGGGEPSQHPQILSIISSLKTTGCDLGIITNGSRLEEQEYRQILCEKMSFIRISLDAVNMELHNRYHGSTDFNLIVDGIKKLTREKSGDYPVIGLTFIVEPEMYRDLQDIVRFSHKLGVDYIQLRLPYTKEVGYTVEYSAEQYGQLLRQMEKFRNKDNPLKVIVGYYLPPSLYDKKDFPLPFEQEYRICYAHKMSCVITADACVFGCCEHRNLGQYSFGRLSYPEMALKDIWSSQKRELVVRKMKEIQCIKHCTSPFSYYNKAIHLKKKNKTSISAFC